MAQMKIISRSLQHSCLCQVIDFQEVPDLINTIIAENPGYTILNSIVIPKKKSILLSEGTIVSCIIGYDCCFILTKNL